MQTHPSQSPILDTKGNPLPAATRDVTVSLAHPKIVGCRKCFGRGFSGWRKDGAAVPCTCVTRLISELWNNLHFGRKMGEIQFTQDSVIARGAA